MIITGTTQKQAWLDRTTPPIERVRDNVWSIPIDFGHTPVRYTFCYLLTNEAGQVLLIDPGWDSGLGREQLLAGLAAAGASLEDIVGIVATHRHADHLGMVGHLHALTGAWFGMHELDATMLDQYSDHLGAIEADRRLLVDLGVPADRVELMLFTQPYIASLDGMGRPSLLLHDGDLLPFAGRNLRVVETPGHTPGHVCIVDEDEQLVFSGDHVLPRISPNIGMTSDLSSAGALEGYFSSLERMHEWPDHEVLPAHEYRFTGLPERSDDLAELHRSRSVEVLALVGSEQLGVWQVAQRMTWARGWETLDGVNLRAALSEAGAHVDYLLETGQLVVVPTAPGTTRLVTTR